MAFISHGDDPSFKFMGRFLLANLSEDKAKEALLKNFREAAEKIEALLL